MRDWLEEYRKDKGFTHEDVATECGITRQYYSLIENGNRDVPVHTAKKIAKTLDFEWTRFFEEEIEK